MTRPPLYITRPLLAVLLEIAGDAEPNPANVYLVASAAGDLEPSAADPAETRSAPSPDHGTVPTPLAELEVDTPVYSDFYFPDVGNALDFVFGVDLGTPAGQSQGRFLSHPDGNPDLTLRDDLHAVVLVAVPPWQAGNVWAYDRDSTRRDLRVVAAETPDDALGLTLESRIQGRFFVQNARFAIPYLTGLRSRTFIPENMTSTGYPTFLTPGGTWRLCGTPARAGRVPPARPLSHHR